MSKYVDANVLQEEHSSNIHRRLQKIFMKKLTKQYRELTSHSLFSTYRNHIVWELSYFSTNPVSNFLPTDIHIQYPRGSLRNSYSAWKQFIRSIMASTRRRYAGERYLIRRFIFQCKFDAVIRSFHSILVRLIQDLLSGELHSSKTLLILFYDRCTCSHPGSRIRNNQRAYIFARRKISLFPNFVDRYGAMVGSR